MTTPFFPATPEPSHIDWALETRKQTFESPLSGSVQNLIFPGGRWQAKLAYRLIHQQDIETLMTFLTQAKSTAERFFFSPPHIVQPALTATPTIIASSSKGSKLFTSGWQTNQKAVLAKGRTISVPLANGGIGLHIITDTSDANARGNAEVSVAPQLRGSVKNKANLIVNNPYCLMRLEDEQDAFAFTKPFVAECTISLIEAF